MSDLVYAAQHDSVNHSMSKNYVPQLKLMREMAIRHGHKEDTFNAKFIKSLELVISLRRTSNGVEESFDVMQYFAEKMTWEHFRFIGSFPGINPTASIYNSSLDLLRYGATYDKMTVPQFNKAFVDCMVGADEEFGRRGMDVAQYEAEKRFWDLRWKKTESFDDVVKRCYSSAFPLRDPTYDADYSPNLKQEAKKIVRKASTLFKRQAKLDVPDGDGGKDSAGLWKKLLRTPSAESSSPELIRKR